MGRAKSGLQLNRVVRVGPTEPETFELRFEEVWELVKSI